MSDLVRLLHHDYSFVILMDGQTLDGKKLYPADEEKLFFIYIKFINVIIS